jgi:myo-inositol-1(or 4)-monophosphatase
MHSAEMDLAQSLATSAGEIMRKNFTLGMKKEWKEVRSPVTETDLAINELVLTEIKRAYPDHSILSEEGSDHDESHEHVWICDPVDGTHNFAHGIPTATFALALTHNGAPVLTVVYDPFLDRMFAAELGRGATLNDEAIHVSASATLKKTLIGMGKMKDVRNLIPVYEAVRESGAQIITGLSTHYLCALVAAGEFSASFFGGRSPHDIAASALLVAEAGGRASDIFGNPAQRYDREWDGLLASNGSVHAELLAIMDRVSPHA